MRIPLKPLEREVRHGVTKVDVEPDRSITALGDTSTVLDLPSSILLSGRDARIDVDLAHALERFSESSPFETLYSGIFNQLKTTWPLHYPLQHTTLLRLVSK